MLPADQRFQTLYAAGGNLHFRLVFERQLVVLDGGAQARDERQPATMLLVAAALVARHAQSSLAGILQRNLYSAQQILRRLSVLRVHANTGRHAEVQCHSGEMKASPQRAGQLVDIDAGTLGGESRRDDEKLTLAEPRND